MLQRYKIVDKRNDHWTPIYAATDRQLYPLNITWENDTYVPPPFVNTHHIIKMHAAPRFGHPRDISLLTSPHSTSDDAINYAVGAFICSILILLFLVLWTIILVVLKILGRKRAGFLSGSMPTVPPLPPLAEIHATGNSTQVDAKEFGKNEGGAPCIVDPEISVIVRGADTEEPKILAEHGEVRDKERANNSNERRQCPVLADGVENSTCVGSNSSLNQCFPCSGGSGGNLKQPAHCAADASQQEHDDQDIKFSIYFDAVQDDESMFSSEYGEALADGSAEGLPSEPTCMSVDTATVDKGLRRRTDPAYIEYEKQVARVERRLRRTRIAVIFCCIAIFVCSGLMMKKGFQSLVDALGDISDSLDQGAMVISRAIEISDEFLLAHNETNYRINVFVDAMPEEWCPDATLTDEQDSQVQAIKAELQQVVAVLKPLGTQIRDTVHGIRNDLDEILEMYARLEVYVNQFAWAHYIAAAFVILLDLLVLATMVNVILAWAKHREKPFVYTPVRCPSMWKPFRCLHSVSFYSVFLVVLFLMWLFTTIFILGAIVGADFCYDSPDPHVANIFEAFGLDRFSTFTYEMLMYYITGCDATVSQFPGHIDKAFKLAVEALDKLHIFLAEVAMVPLDELTDYCGMQSSSIILLAHVLDAQLHTYVNALVALRELFFCENFHPIYAGIAHNALCYSGVQGLTWLYTTQFAIAICCMVIVTLRVAWEDETKSSKGGTSDIEEEQVSTIPKQIDSESNRAEN